MKKRKIVVYFVIFIPLFFYLFFAFYDGPVLIGDSWSYMNISEAREPLYPLMILLLKNIFGTKNDLYLQVLVVIQSLLIAYVTTDICFYLKKEYGLSDLLFILIMIIQLGISLLFRFASQRSSMFSNSILSEGISFPLFLLFFRYSLDFLLNNKNKELIISAILSFLLISTRKQMYITLILLFVIMTVVSLNTKRVKLNLLKSFFLIVVVFSSVKAFDFGYMVFNHQVFGTHTSDNRFLTTMVIYTSNREDANLIKDKEVKELFIKVYDKCETNGYLKNTFKGGWNERVDHFTAHYDDVQLESLMPIMQDYAKTIVGNREEDVSLMVDKYNSILVKALLPSVLGEMTLTFLDNILAGLIITISTDRNRLFLYSLFMYVIYFALIIKGIKRNGLNHINILCLYTLLSILVNVVLVSLLIFCQNRYTMYNTPLFYISFLMLINEEVTNRHGFD